MELDLLPLEAVKEKILVAARHPSVNLAGTRDLRDGSTVSRVLVRSIGDLERYAIFINHQVEEHNARYGIKKVLGEVLGCSPNRIGEWQRIWLAATSAQYGPTLASLVVEKKRPLSNLVSALRTLGWTPARNSPLVAATTTTTNGAEAASPSPLHVVSPAVDAKVIDLGPRSSRGVAAHATISGTSTRAGLPSEGWGSWSYHPFNNCCNSGGSGGGTDTHRNGAAPPAMLASTRLDAVRRDSCNTEGEEEGECKSTMSEERLSGRLDGGGGTVMEVGSSYSSPDDDHDMMQRGRDTTTPCCLSPAVSPNCMSMGGGSLGDFISSFAPFEGLELMSPWSPFEIDSPSELFSGLSPVASFTEDMLW